MAKAGRPKGAVSKTNEDIRSLLRLLVDRRLPQMEAWLDRVAEEDPGRAFGYMLQLLEYHVPKLARVELGGVDGSPVLIQNVMQITDEQRKMLDNVIDENL